MTDPPPLMVMPVGISMFNAAGPRILMLILAATEFLFNGLELMCLLLCAHSLAAKKASITGVILMRSRGPRIILCVPTIHSS